MTRIPRWLSWSFGALLVAGVALAVNSNPTHYMNMTLPVPGVTPGPQWATLQYNADQVIDAHNHDQSVGGMGAPIPTTALNINATLPFNGYAATLLNHTAYTDIGAGPPATTAAIYNDGGDLWWNSGSSGPVQITIGGVISGATSGSINGCCTGGASADFGITTSHAFAWKQAANKGAYMESGRLIIHDDATTQSPFSAQGVTIQAASGTGIYTITLPSAAASGSTLPVSMSTSGMLSTATITAAQITTGSITTTQISNSAGITGTQIAGTTIAAANIANSTITDGKMASHTLTYASIKTPTFVVPTLSSGWTGSSGFAYWVDQLSMVHIRGEVSNNGTGGTTIFSLPSSYQPMNTRVFQVHVDGAISAAYISINNAGAVVCNTGSVVENIWLDPISFFAEQ